MARLPDDPLTSNGTQTTTTSTTTSSRQSSVTIAGMQPYNMYSRLRNSDASFPFYSRASFPEHFFDLHSPGSTGNLQFVEPEFEFELDLDTIFRWC